MKLINMTFLALLLTSLGFAEDFGKVKFKLHFSGTTPDFGRVLLGNPPENEGFIIFSPNTICEFEYNQNGKVLRVFKRVDNGSFEIFINDYKGNGTYEVPAIMQIYSDGYRSSSFINLYYNNDLRYGTEEKSPWINYSAVYAPAPSSPCSVVISDSNSYKKISFTCAYLGHYFSSTSDRGSFLSRLDNVEGNILFNGKGQVP